MIDKFIYILHNKIGWTTNDDFKNVLDKEIADYSSQMLANILDIIKDPTKNINTYNFNILSSFPDMGIPYDEMTLFASQPILKELSELHYESVSLLEADKNDKKIIEKIKRTYQTKLYKLLKESGKKDILSYNKSMTNNGLINVNRNATLKDLGYEVDLPTLDNVGTSKFEYPSARDYVNLLKESLEPIKSIEYYRKQLQILEMFVVYKKTGQAYQDGMKAFSADKIGAGSTIDVTDDLKSNIKAATNYTQDFDKIYNKETKKIDKIEKGARLLIGSKPATEMIYPRFFQNFSDRSSYRMLESYLEFSNIRAVKSLSTLFINRVPVIMNLLSDIKSNINITSTNKEIINKKVNGFVNVHLLNDLPFFTSIDKQRILGINKEYNLQLDISDEDNFEIFKNLSVANKLDLIKNQLVQSKFGIENKKYDIKSTDTHILNYLSSKSSKKDIDNNDYEQINFRSDGENEDYMVESFNDMWYSKNPFLRDLSQDLVKYAYITSGLTFGQTSLGKIIPTNILMGDLNNDSNPKGIEVASHLRNKFDEYSNLKSNSFDIKNKFFRWKSNWKNDDIVPTVKSSKIIDEETGKEILDETKIKWFPNKKGYIEVDLGMLKKEPKLIQNANTVKLYHGGLKETILYQKYDYFNDGFEGTVEYYPVTKLEDYEYTDKSFLDKNNTGVLYTEQEYIDIIHGVDNSTKLENIEKPFDNIEDKDIDEQIKKCN